MRESTLRSFFLARQPIVDLERRLVAYEILFRGVTASAAAEIVDGDSATAQVLTDAVLLDDLRSLTDGKPAFLNFTRRLLVDGLGLVLPPGAFVVEILEDVEFDADVERACRELRRGGIPLALDDVVSVDRIRQFAPLVSWVKVDVQAVEPSAWGELVQAAHRARARVIAEKVERADQLSVLRSLGIDCVQGYAVGRPQGLVRSSLQGLSGPHHRLLQAVLRPEFDLDEVTAAVAADPSLTYRVLAFANSARAAQRRRIQSLRDAVVLCGANQIRRAALLLTVAGLYSDAARHELHEVLLRALLGEALAAAAGHEVSRFEHFLAGLIVALERVAGLPIAATIERLPLTAELVQGLRSGTGPCVEVAAVAELCSLGAWEAAAMRALRLGVTEHQLMALHGEALRASGAYVDLAVAA